MDGWIKQTGQNFNFVESRQRVQRYSLNYSLSLKNLKKIWGKFEQKVWGLEKDWPGSNLNKLTGCVNLDKFLNFGASIYLCSEDSNNYFQTTICYTLIFCISNI